MGAFCLKNIFFLAIFLLLWLSCMESTCNARRVGSHWRQNSISSSASLSNKKNRKHGSNYLHHGQADKSAHKAHSPKAPPPALTQPPALAPPLPLVPPPTGGHKTRSPPPTTPPPAAPPPVPLPPPTGGHKGIHQPPAAQPPTLTPPLAPPSTGGHKGSPPPPNKGEQPPGSTVYNVLDKACVSNVTVRDVFFRGSTNGVRIKTWQGGIGSVQGIQFSNIQVSEVQLPIIIDQYYCDARSCKNQTSAVALSGISYENIRGTYTVSPVHFACSDSMPCTDVTLTSIDLQPQKQQRHMYDPYCWQAFGKLLSPTTPPVNCLQIGKPASNNINLGINDSC